MASPKLKSPTHKRQVIAYIVRLDRRGWSQWQIRDELAKPPPDGLDTDISQPMVSKYLKDARAEASQEILKDRKEQVEFLISQYNEELRECWRALDKSWLDEESESEEFGDCREQVSPDDYVTSEARVKRIVAKKGRLPASQWMAQIQGIHKAVRELLGLDEEVHQNMMKIEEAERVLRAVLEACREVLADVPDKLAMVQQRTLQLIQQINPVQAVVSVPQQVVEVEPTEGDDEQQSS